VRGRSGPRAPPSPWPSPPAVRGEREESALDPAALEATGARTHFANVTFPFLSTATGAFTHPTFA
jgi:hypothetical protein